MNQEIVRRRAGLDDDGNVVRRSNVAGGKSGKADAERALTRRMRFIQIAVRERRRLRREKE